MKLHRQFFKSLLLLLAMFWTVPAAAISCDPGAIVTANKFLASMDLPNQAAVVFDLLDSRTRAHTSASGMMTTLENRDIALGLVLPDKGFSPREKYEHTKIYEHDIIQSELVSGFCNLQFISQYPAGPWHGTMRVIGYSGQYRISSYTESMGPIAHFIAANTSAVTSNPHAELKSRIDVVIDCNRGHCDPIQNPKANNPGSIVSAIRIAQQAGEFGPALTSQYALSSTSSAVESPNQWVLVPLRAANATIKIIVPNAEEAGSPNPSIEDYGAHDAKSFLAKSGDTAVATIVVRPDIWNRRTGTGKTARYVIRHIKVQTLSPSASAP